jgi:hypothetical protein
MSQKILEFFSESRDLFCSVALGLDKHKKLTIPARSVLFELFLS